MVTSPRDRSNTDLSSRNFYWSSMHEDIKHVISSCNICNKVKKKPVALRKVTLRKGNKKAKIIAMDTFGEKALITRRGFKIYW